MWTKTYTFAKSLRIGALDSQPPTRIKLYSSKRGSNEHNLLVLFTWLILSSWYRQQIRDAVLEIKTVIIARSNSATINSSAVFDSECNVFSFKQYTITRFNFKREENLKNNSSLSFSNGKPSLYFAPLSLLEEDPY